GRDAAAGGQRRQAGRADDLGLGAAGGAAARGQRGVAGGAAARGAAARAGARAAGGLAPAAFDPRRVRARPVPPAPLAGGRRAGAGELSLRRSPPATLRIASVVRVDLDPPPRHAFPGARVAILETTGRSPPLPRPAPSRPAKSPRAAGRKRRAPRQEGRRPLLA